MDIQSKLYHLFEDKFYNEVFKNNESLCDSRARESWYSYLKSVPGVIALGWPLKKIKFPDGYIRVEDPYNQATFILIDKKYADKILVLGL